MPREETKKTWRRLAAVTRRLNAAKRLRGLPELTPEEVGALNLLGAEALLRAPVDPYRTAQMLAGALIPLLHILRAENPGLADALHLESAPPPEEPRWQQLDPDLLLIYDHLVLERKGELLGFIEVGALAEKLREVGEDPVRVAVVLAGAMGPAAHRLAADPHALRQLRLQLEALEVREFL